jgi:hypothetical protein
VRLDPSGIQSLSMHATGHLQVGSTVVVAHTGHMSSKLTEIEARVSISSVVAGGERYCSVARHSNTDRAVAIV